MPQPDKGLWPYLPSSSRPERFPNPQKPSHSLAATMFPGLGPKDQPKPQPARYRPQSTGVSLAQLCDENPALERGLALAGLRRIR
jgi:hypothetical protein